MPGETPYPSPAASPNQHAERLAKISKLSERAKRLWDELDVLIPAGEDPCDLTTPVLKLVSEKTQADVALAEQERKRITHNSAIQSFSALPAIEVRPTNLGVNLVVRYVVNAQARHEVRTRLYQAIVELLHSKKLAQAGVAGAIASS